MNHSTLGYFFIFFIKLFNSYLIKCQEEKMKTKIVVGLNGAEPEEKRNTIFLWNYV